MLGCIAGGAAVSAVAAHFDGADQRAAERLVRDFRSGHGSLLELLGEGTPLPAAEWEWRTETVSTLYHHVRVHVTVPRALRLPEDFAFDVDLGERSIHPGNPAAERVLRVLLAP